GLTLVLLAAFAVAGSQEDGRIVAHVKDVVDDRVVARRRISDRAHFATIAIKIDSAVVESKEDVVDDDVVAGAVDGHDFTRRRAGVDVVVSEGVAKGLGIEINIRTGRLTVDLGVEHLKIADAAVDVEGN